MKIKEVLGTGLIVVAFCAIASAVIWGLGVAMGIQSGAEKAAGTVAVGQRWSRQPACEFAKPVDRRTEWTKYVIPTRGALLYVTVKRDTVVAVWGQ
jgi:hypothetical protein